ncbi:MAG: YidC/Oxa1 family insertase periplasmic-domain containing protein, partial [Bacteroidia bacterium]|nr:YidC/Oxa1 family insertase periplasmic-domain containing protein [Bacteroidia bacterium]
MDRNTIIGIVIIFGIIILFSILNQPSKEELEVARKRQDSIIKVNEKIAQEKIQNELAAKEAARQELTADTTITDSIKLDSINKVNLQNRLGLFSQSAEGKNEFITLENNKLKVLISTLGGRVYSAELKNYKTWDSLHLILFDGDSSTFGLRFFSGTKDIHTNQLFFTPVTGENKLIAENNPIAASLHLNVAPGKYIEYKYLLEPDSYILKFNIRFKGMQDVISTS